MHDVTDIVALCQTGFCFFMLALFGLTVMAEFPKELSPLVSWGRYL